MPAAPDAFLNRDLLRRLAGEQSFASGERCFASGRVQRLRAAEEKVSAQVAGALTHRVKLWRGQDQLCYKCDCEAGQASTFCKHCVAVGLAWITRLEHPLPGHEVDHDTKAARSKEDRARREERQRLANHLETLDPKRLVSLVLEATDYDEILWRRLLLETIGISNPKPPRGEAKARNKPDFATYQQLLKQAVSPQGHVDYHALPDFVQGIEEAIAPLTALLDAGWQGEVIALTEFVLIELDAASDRVDIGDGLFNRIYDELQRTHLAACRAGAPVAGLAARLLHYELEGGLGIFNNAVKTYADVLGEEGVAIWRSLLVREWQATRASTPSLLDHRRFQAQGLVERMAKEMHDFDALIALKSADLESVHDQIGLVEWLMSLGRTTEAIRCAESNAAKCENDPEKILWRELLLTAYQKAGRIQDALNMAWAQFSNATTSEHFRELRSVVQKADSAGWLAWRERVLALVREQAKHERSQIVELLIEERSYDQAWQEASLGACRDDLLLLLAEKREHEQPLDALQVYRRHIGVLLSQGPRTGYAEPVALIVRVRELFRRLHRESDYADYIASLRSEHRHKRGFLRSLKAAGA